MFVLCYFYRSEEEESEEEESSSSDEDYTISKKPIALKKIGGIHCCERCTREEECPSCLKSVPFTERCACCGICNTCTQVEGRAHMTYCKSSMTSARQKLDETLKFALQIQKEEDDLEDWLPRREASLRGYNLYGEHIEAGIHFLHMTRIHNQPSPPKKGRKKQFLATAFRPRPDTLIVSPQDAARLVPTANFTTHTNIKILNLQQFL